MLCFRSPKNLHPKSSPLSFSFFLIPKNCQPALLPLFLLFFEKSLWWTVLPLLVCSVFFSFFLFPMSPVPAIPSVPRHLSLLPAAIFIFPALCFLSQNLRPKSSPQLVFEFLLLPHSSRNISSFSSNYSTVPCSAKGLHPNHHHGKVVVSLVMRPMQLGSSVN